MCLPLWTLTPSTSGRRLRNTAATFPQPTEPRAPRHRDDVEEPVARIGVRCHVEAGYRCLADVADDDLNAFGQLLAVDLDIECREGVAEHLPGQAGHPSQESRSQRSLPFRGDGVHQCRIDPHAEPEEHRSDLAAVLRDHADVDRHGVPSRQGVETSFEVPVQAEGRNGSVACAEGQHRHGGAPRRVGVAGDNASHHLAERPVSAHGDDKVGLCGHRGDASGVSPPGCALGLDLEPAPFQPPCHTVECPARAPASGNRIGDDHGTSRGARHSVGSGKAVAIFRNRMRAR